MSLNIALAIIFAFTGIIGGLSHYIYFIHMAYKGMNPQWITAKINIAVTIMAGIACLATY
jgi:heme/copper-type cytochrome/quinol oxidase subunit 4